MKHGAVSRGQLLSTIAVVTAILFVTLMPSGRSDPLAFSDALDVDRRWLADGILNLFLFVPFGIAVGWNSRSRWMPVAFGVILSAVVELAQTMVPGRDPALSDIVFNTLGVVIGGLIARYRNVLLRPNPRRSAILTLVAGTAILGATGATVFLLSPTGPAVVTRSDNDLLLRYPTRAEAIGLDEPEYWLEGANKLETSAATSDAVVSRERNHWRFRTGSEQIAVGPTVGQGWTLLGYPNAIARRWGPFLNGVWLLVLCLPVGLWARGYLLAVAAVLGTLVLVFIPTIAGGGPTMREEWVGAAIGLLAGRLLQHLLGSLPRGASA